MEREREKMGVIPSSIAKTSIYLHRRESEREDEGGRMRSGKSDGRRGNKEGRKGGREG